MDAGRSRQSSLPVGMKKIFGSIPDRSIVSNRQDYKPQNVYIVLNGRVRSVLLTQDKKRRELIGEHGRGEMVGLIEVLMEMPRQSTTIAVR